MLELRPLDQDMPIYQQLNYSSKPVCRPIAAQRHFKAWVPETRHRISNPYQKEPI